ncbi:OmcA/MtrC family decaheme c-type cytochrome [Paraferrimonas sedimenticola]|uniref:Cytochrome c n=1 Tax=Paraferrimonas sedimenticola TaxID=375674 RepID=A0AA37W028_9GAMM|nr:OmcA/MtrC family decaheme c-type cytochrome [Paraferrimonas sedimenticola]GLP94798.1 cytochrome c [Paraferrimonas sedimenticola]
MNLQFNLSLATKAILGAGVLSMALTGCARDGKDGDQGKPGEPGGPGPVTVDIREASALQATIIQTEIVDGRVSVEFDLVDGNGVAVSGLNELDSIHTLGFGIAKLSELQTRTRPLPGHPTGQDDASTYAKGFKTQQWTSYINRMVDPVTPPNTDGFPENWDRHQGPQIQASIDSSCQLDCVELVDDGIYRYTFSKALNEYDAIEGINTDYQPELVHRVTMELNVESGAPAVKLINTFYDFIPETGQAAPADETRNLVSLEESCIRCHSNDYDHAWAPKLVFHGGRRTNIENCVVCHTSYSGDPETGETVDFGAMLHRIHKSKSFIVGYGGRGHDYSKVTFPAEYNACQACHIQGEDAPAQANYFNFHRQEACLSCHEPSTDEGMAGWDGTAKGLFHDPERFPNAWEQGCSSCHADDNQSLGATQFHMATQSARAQASDLFAIETRNASFERLSETEGTLTFEVKVSNPSDGSSYNTPVHEIAQISKLPVRAMGNANYDYNFDVPPGDESNARSYTARYNSYVGDLVAELKKTESPRVTVSQGDDGFFVYQVANVAMQKAEQGNLTAHLEICAEKGGTAVDCNAGEDVKLVTAKVLTSAITFATETADTEVRRMVVDNAKCQSCHEGQMNTSKDRGIHTDTGKDESSSCIACHDRSMLSGNFEDGSCASCHNNSINNYHSSFVRPLNNSLDYKVLAHSLHASKRTHTNDDGEQESSAITYPEHYANCGSCHNPGQLTLTEVAMQKAVVASQDGEVINVSPTTATCAACHEGHGGDSFKSHAIGNGGVWGPEPYVPGTESCAACHAEGKSHGVDIVHPVRYK